MALTEVDAARLNDNVFNTVGPFTNRIINGDMRIAQRGTAAVTSSGQFPVDRWQTAFVTTGAVAVSGNTTAPAGFDSSILFDVTTADTSIAAGEFASILQSIEGNNVADLSWGTADAKTVTLSFWVRSTTTGTYCVKLGNSGANRSYVAEYTVNAANTWEYKTITVPGDTSGVWLATNALGIVVLFTFATGTTFQTTANTWAAGNFLGTSNQVNLLASTTNEIYITGVQLEAGSVATPFERRSYGQELALCQRYYYRITRNASVDIRIGVGQAIGTGTGDYMVQYPVTMRDSPTALEQSGTAADYQVLSSNGTFITASAVPTHQTGSLNTATLRVSVASGLTAGSCSFLSLQDTGNGYLGWSAEL